MPALPEGISTSWLYKFHGNAEMNSFSSFCRHIDEVISFSSLNETLGQAQAH
jgi:hypothetical protein